MMLVNTNLIKAECAKRKWSNYDLAKRANIAKGTLSRLLIQRSASIQTIKKVGQALDLNANQILSPQFTDY